MTETPPGTGSTYGRDGDWNRQTSTVDWEGWIAEANEADAKRAEAQAAADAAAAAAPPHQFPAPQFPGQQYPGQQVPSAHYPAQHFPTGQPSYSAPNGYAPAGGYPPSGYPQPGAAFQPFAVPTKPRLDAVSVLALIFGILPTVLIGFVLGVIGLVRTRQPARRGRGLAVTGLVLSLLWAAAVVAIPVLTNNGDAQRSASGSVTKTATVSAWLLRVGDCFDNTLPTNQAFTSKSMSTVKVVPCSQPHNAVVYAITTLPATGWTSALDKLNITYRQCQPLALNYFNGIVLDPNLKLGAIAPQQAQWETGFHNGLCIVVDPDKSFVGDIRQDR